MTASELRRMRILLNRYPRACFQVEKAMARATRCTPLNGGLPQGNGNGGGLEKGALLVMEAKRTRDELGRALMELRAKIAPEIDGLERPLDRLVMRMRYLEGYSAREISVRLNYSEDWIFKRLRSAQRQIARE